jgi:2-polyprenyl-3-methyl-5-hydroxy-6-metoxy-1,4-benzoquinol methylase
MIYELGKKTIIGGFENVSPDLASKYLFAAKYSKGKKVFDLGCAGGYGSYYIASEKGGKAKTVVGLDISQKAIKYAKKHWQLPNLVFVNASALSLPFKDKHFDLVISLEVIEHVTDYKKYLSEVGRVLKSNGTAIISTPNKAFTSPNTKHPIMASHIKEFFIDELEKELKSVFTKVILRGQKIGPSVYLKNRQKYYQSWRFKLLTAISQIKLVRAIGLCAPQWINNIVAGNSDKAKGLKIEDTIITKTPHDADTIVAICDKI